MKKKVKILILASVFLMVFALSVGVVFADTVQDQLIEEVKEEPVSIFTYANYTWDFLTEAAKRFAASAKPLVIFNKSPRMGGEITIYEEKLFAVTMGKYLKENRQDPNTLEFEPGWFFGVEFKLPEWPPGTDLGEMFSKLRPQALLHQGTWYFGLAYQFRNKKES